MRVNLLDWLAILLVVIGAISWGLVGLLDLNVVTALFANNPMVVKAIYCVVGLAGIYMIYFAFKISK
jgi:uncharacterized protein